MNPLSLWKDWRDCSESELVLEAQALARELRLGDRILLEGEMGVGKSTFARALLLALETCQPPEGSPSFPIIHVYDSKLGPLAHIDFYRLQSEAEIDLTGIPEYLWDPETLCICEWLSMWPVFEEKVKGSGRIWEVSLRFPTELANAGMRKLKIFHCK